MSDNELNENVETVEETTEEFTEEVEETVETTNDTNTEEFTEEVEEAVEDNTADEFVDKKKEEDDSEDAADTEDDDEEDDEKKPKNQHSLEEFEALQAELDSLRAENEELRNFKLNIENQQKDALIASYHMLSDEDKKEVIDHKAEYSYEDIKAKLAVIYVEKNVNFDMIDGQEEEADEAEPAMTFSLDEEASEGVPAFVEALRHTQNK